MENNDQNTTTNDVQPDPQPNEKPCCSAAPKGLNSWKTVVLLVILLLAGAVTARSILKNGPAGTCGPGGCPSAGTCSKAQEPATCSADKTACSADKLACSADKPGCSTDKPACSAEKSACQGETAACPSTQKPAACTSDTKTCPESAKKAVPGCCPSVAAQDVIQAACPKEAQ